MGALHDDVLRRLKKLLEEEFGEKCVSTSYNNLPTGSGREESLYRPDVIVCDDRLTKKNIRYIFEIERYGWKGVPGAAILADYCISKHVQNGIQISITKPQLIFLMLGPEQEKRAKKRISAIKDKIENLAIDIWGIKGLKGKVAGLR